MARIITTAFFVLATLGIVGTSTSLGADTKAISDEDFLIQAVTSGQAEVRFSELAEKQASNLDVKNFAAQMVKDHTSANKDLLTQAKGMKVAIVTGLNKDRRTAYDNLAKFKGEDFDREYMRIMVDDHEKARSLFQNYSTTGKNDEVRQFATKTLPTLKHHLEGAKNILAKLKK